MYSTTGARSEKVDLPEMGDFRQFKISWMMKIARENGAAPSAVRAEADGRGANVCGDSRPSGVLD